MSNSTESLAKRQFPTATVQQDGDNFYFVTIHGVGKTAQAAMEAAIADFNRMSQDGRDFPQILADIKADLSSPGMSKARHDSLLDLLNTAQNCLNDGILTNTIPFLLIPGYNKELETLSKRVSERLAMTALDMQLQEKARKKAGVKHPRPRDASGELISSTDQGAAYRRLMSTGRLSMV